MTTTSQREQALADTAAFQYVQCCLCSNVLESLFTAVQLT